MNANANTAKFTEDENPTVTGTVTDEIRPNPFDL